MQVSDIRVETERLLLRLPQAEDFDAYAANMADIGAAHFIGGPQTREVAWRGFVALAGAWLIQGYSMFSVIEKSSGDWIGRLGPWFPEGWPGTEVGWGLVRSAQGKGYAFEATVAAIDWTFEHTDWTDVVHSIHPANFASQALARRLGSSNRGPGKLPPPLHEVPVDIWGQTREQWYARKR